MASIPECPNVREKACERSELRLTGESDSAWYFFCKNCHLCWTVSKPRTRERAQWENSVDRVRRITDEERAIASRTRYFVMPGGSR